MTTTGNVSTVHNINLLNRNKFSLEAHLFVLFEHCCNTYQSVFSVFLIHFSVPLVQFENMSDEFMAKRLGKESEETRDDQDSIKKTRSEKDKMYEKEKKSKKISAFMGSRVTLVVV